MSARLGIQCPGRWQNEIDVAEQIVGFLQQFLEVFSELKGKNFYLTGESVSPPPLYQL